MEEYNCQTCKVVNFLKDNGLVLEDLLQVIQELKRKKDNRIRHETLREMLDFELSKRFREYGY